MKKKKNNATVNAKDKKKGIIKRVLFFWKKSKDRKDDEKQASRTDIHPSERAWDEPSIVRDLSFPGPRGSEVAMRIACDRQPYADLIAHARESPDREICGVLVGQWGEDADGVFAHIQAIIRGESARQGSTHVTFTQETWNKIHDTLDRDHRKRRIIGWYHTHPGFGVQFSDMDLFIQQNFFSSAYQIALLYDPVAGQTAICVNMPDGIQYVDRFWVDGKEMSCAPAPLSVEKEKSGIVLDDSGRIHDLETRINQLVQANERLHEFISKVLLNIFMIISFAALFWIALTVYDKFFSPEEPPERVLISRIPINVNGQFMFLGLELVKWEAPPELQKRLLEQLDALNENQKQSESEGNQTESAAQPGASKAASEQSEIEQDLEK